MKSSIKVFRIKMTVRATSNLDLWNRADSRTRPPCYLRELAFKHFILSVSSLGIPSSRVLCSPGSQWIYISCFICIWPFPKETLLRLALHIRTRTHLLFHRLTLISSLDFVLTKLFQAHICGKAWYNGNIILSQGRDDIFKG